MRFIQYVGRHQLAVKKVDTLIKTCKSNLFLFSFPPMTATCDEKNFLVETDRSNMVAMEEPDRSFPHYGAVSGLFDDAKVIHALDGRLDMTSADIAIAMATAGKYNDATNVPADLNKLEQCNRQQLAQLDCYPPSYAGLLLQFKKGVYYYVCSRNNNFTNRSQKGRLAVSD